MKKSLSLLTISLAFISNHAFADTSMVENTSAGPSHPLGFEVEVQSSYVGGGSVEREGTDVDLDEWNFSGRVLILPVTPVGILRLGVEYTIYDFDVPDNMQVPDRLQAATFIVGLDTKLSDSLLLRFEARPGLYSGDELEGGDFDVPFILGGTYLYSSTLQFVFGIGVDFQGEYIVFPGGGVRWKFAPQWVLNATAPTPRLEYEFNNNLLLYAGGDLRGGNFRVDNDFVGDPGDPGDLNNTIVRYLEVRAGAGLAWKIGEAGKLTFEAGYVPFRSFNYHRTEVRWHSDGGGFYGAATFKLAF